MNNMSFLIYPKGKQCKHEKDSSSFRVVDWGAFLWVSLLFLYRHIECEYREEQLVCSIGYLYIVYAGGLGVIIWWVGVGSNPVGCVKTLFTRTFEIHAVFIRFDWWGGMMALPGMASSFRGLPHQRYIPPRRCVHNFNSISFDAHSLGSAL